jgi:hypothetical protein
MVDAWVNDTDPSWQEVSSREALFDTKALAATECETDDGLVLE